ncbi:DUF2723 domain-containing protein [Flavipsychrobacter stenotrophus]|uniref:DUF2723 domain-containing protein n=1 Tax=Flavipsychrobacter stenotrophus TaxID=2077091 RepID=A0A2S7SXQ9_9BACT|nr:DUF2723 domain-containing protein [Flavipsychrobacter stenotrophus]PQJ11365.1 DUF2723 domain-containing protein [Flavipsychrobacter stenotrophus]
MHYRKVNNLLGWVTGAIALFVYISTMEPTVSFWDCGEFLSCAYKLEVGHSPGAPLFMMMQRMFAIFSGGNALTGGDSTHAAYAINAMSAVASALTILFLFWTITHFAKKLLVKKGDEPDGTQLAIIMGAGLVGGLAYTFSDTFWFSAVEAEVYATSSFFTAITFWAVLKWEDVADEKHSDRWLVLIAYLLGLSVCVHLLNLLTIPAVAMVYYYRRYDVTVKGTILAFLAGCGILGFVQFGVIQYIPKIASKFDIMFTNGFGMSFDMGSLFFLAIVIGLLVFGIYYSKKKSMVSLHTAVLCIIFIIIGYSSYFVAIIRSRADVPIDMTNPDNPISFLDYVNREQFGQQPIFFGPYFNSQYDEIDTSGKLYSQSKANGKDHYDIVGAKRVPIYKGNQSHFFPRIWDQEGNHVNFYKSMLNLADGQDPTSSDNLKYFFGYQMNWMWWRFFMWNYAGRQNDIEGQLDPERGNWISGIGAVDKMRGLGDTEGMGEGYTRNGAHNKLYFLPFILGIMGLVYQFNRKRNDGMVVLMMFFFTGAAIGIFLNMNPLQPRERDYAFAGCTYTFAIWIGLGVLMVNDWFQKAMKGSVGAYASTGICLVAVPVLMANVEWDDHDRSHKTLAHDVAHNTLSACAPNAVLFTFGDNQTYPLWYIQEIEGFRKDIRIINTSLLGIDWYVDQLNYKTNQADAVPMIWKKADYTGERANYIMYYDNPKVGLSKTQYINLADVCTFMNSNDPNAKVGTRGGNELNYMPTKNFFVPTMSKEDLVKNGLATAADTANIITDMRFNYPKESAYKSDLAILNIIAAVAKEGWKRPLYFDAGLRTGDYGGTGDFLRLEGTVYRLMPYKFVDSIKKNSPILGTINTEKSYNLFMGYTFGGGERNDVYFDEPNRHEFVTYRMDASYIANALVAEGKKDQAVKLLDKVMAGITEHSYYYDYTAYFIAAAYYRAGELKKGQELTKKIVRNSQTILNWAASLEDNNKDAVTFDIRQQFQVMQSLASSAFYSGDTSYAKTIANSMQRIQPNFGAQLKQNAPVAPQAGEEE